MADLYALLYRSHAARALDERDLLPILTTSLRNNARAGVTGLLLYGPPDAPPPVDEDAPPAAVLVPFDGPGVFVQWLEGPEAAVRATFDRIRADARHTDVEEVLGDFRPRRLFPAWAMALELGYPLPATAAEMEAFAAAQASAPPTDPSLC